MVQLFLPKLRPEGFTLAQTAVNGHQLVSWLARETDEDVSSIVALSFGGKVWDLDAPIPSESQVELVSRSEPKGLEILRHSAAHILAQAVKEVYPETQVTIGPVIDNGFYYDFYRETPFQTEDLLRLQERMREIVQRDLPIHRHHWQRQQAVDFFRAQGETFKAELINSFPQEEEISVYTQGDFTDLCRGPHVPSTAALGEGFQLMKVSGAYWRGDPANPQLQRIYGTAWSSREELERYLHHLSEAEKRDHRKLARDMDLFHFQPEAPGSVFWHPKGWTVYRLLQNYIREKLENQYHEINTPQVVSCSLWQKSGHWDVFRKNMVTITHNDLLYALKPMSCPCHIQVYNQGTKSYRDLPLRYAEFGRVTREEPSGALAGLMRLRAFVQDDGHVFCAPEHLVEETKTFCHTLFAIYKELGFEDVLVRFSTRPDERLGSDELWDKAEASLQEGTDAAGLSCIHFPKEGAFYGPKLEFVLKDSLGRLWQCGTLQVDFMMPERLGAFYVDREGVSRPCVILHRAILGSVERFMGVLLEHTGGRLPFWLAPLHIAVVTISEKATEYGQRIGQALKDAGLRVLCDFRQEKIGYKIREHTLAKIPCMAVLGVKEAQEGLVSLRIGQENRVLPWQEAVEFLGRQAAHRSASPFPPPPVERGQSPHTTL